MGQTVNQRLKQFVERKKLSNKEFANSILVSEVSVSRWFSLIESFPLKHLNTLLLKFPDLNARWLITGDGDMFDLKCNKNENEDEFKNYKSLHPEEKPAPEILNSVLMRIEDMREYIIKLEKDKEYLRSIVHTTRKRKEIIIDMLVHQIKNIKIYDRDREKIYMELLEMLQSGNDDSGDDVSVTE